MTRSILALVLLLLAGCGQTTAPDAEGGYFHRFSPADPQNMPLVLGSTAPASLVVGVATPPGQTAHTHTGPAIITEPFTHAVFSWNVNAGPGVAVWFEVRVLDAATGEWSPWLYLGRAGDPDPALRPANPVTRFSGGTIDIDCLTGLRPFRVYQMRIDIRGGLAVVSNLAVTTTTDAAALTTAPPQTVPTAPVEIAVPFRSQKTERPELAGRLCSPTSVAMVLAAYGIDTTVDEVARRAYDPDHDIYGNWPRNVQAAYSFGVRGMVTRVQSWAEAARFLHAGIPIIASIYAEKGELRGAPYEGTEGHLIVIRGFDTAGDVLVNDPAAATPETGMLTYRRDDLTRVWLRNTRGTAYILEPPARGP